MELQASSHLEETHANVLNFDHSNYSKRGVKKRPNALMCPFKVFCQHFCGMGRGEMPGNWRNKRPFARSDHMARNKPCWEADNAVGLPKQGKSYQSNPAFLCFEYGKNIQNGQKTRDVRAEKRPLQITDEQLKYCKHFIEFFFTIQRITDFVTLRNSQ